jgi:transcriptional regulator with XRE-family HTH domain
MLWSGSGIDGKVPYVPRTSRPDPDLAAYIRSSRQARGVTQEDLAHAADVALSTLQAIEAGRREPGWSTVLAILDALELSLSKLAAEMPSRSEGTG